MINEPAAYAARRRFAVVEYNGVSYTRDLSLCRRALTDCQVGGEYLGGLAELAETADCSRSTASRFFSGRNLSMDVTRRLLDFLTAEESERLVSALIDTDYELPI